MEFYLFQEYKYSCGLIGPENTFCTTAPIFEAQTLSFKGYIRNVLTINTQKAERATL
jgi:hypothetical protein